MKPLIGAPTVEKIRTAYERCEQARVLVRAASRELEGFSSKPVKTSLELVDAELQHLANFLRTIAK